jgi:hypothetical protein
MFDPMYGELLHSRQVSEITGLTMNQLRNFRIPERIEKAPFPFLRIGGAAMYRKADVELWLSENGGPQAIQYVTAPHHKTAPLLNDMNYIEKRNAFSQLGRITTENSFTSMATWAIEQSGLPNGTRLIHDEGRRLLALERGIEDWKTLPIPAVTLKETDQEGFWKIWTYGVRRAFVIANQLDVTDEEVMQIPVGDIPPMKTK